MADIRDAVKLLRERGEHTIRLKPKLKKPAHGKWQINPPDEPDTFEDDENVGSGNGKEITPNKFSVDFDLDWPEAREAAERLALSTNFIYGRPSESRSHRGYTSDSPMATFSFTLDKKQKEAEVLRLGGVGSQSMMPPSVHESGEVVRFDVDGERGHHANVDLFDNARLVATTAALARFWPPAGSRHQGVLDLAGWLLTRAKLSDFIVKEIVSTAAKIAGDPESRIADVDSTVAKVKSGTDVTANLDVFGEQVEKVLRDWFKVKAKKSKDDEDEKLLDYFPKEILFHRTGLRNETFFMDRGRALPLIDTSDGEYHLRDAYYLDEGKGLTDATVRQTLLTAHARARHGQPFDVFTRCAFVDGVVYLDPCWGDDDSVIAVTASGWSILPCPESIKFTRPQSILPLPDLRRVQPTPDINALRELYNLSDDDYKLLMASSTVSMFGTPRVGMSFNGEYGTGKTSMGTNTKNLLDPCSLTPTIPKDIRGLASILRASWSPQFTNLTSIDVEMSNAFCNLLDGKPVTLPTLYKTAELTVVPAQGPIFFDGVNDFIHEGDLSDRVIVFRPKTLDTFRTDDAVNRFFAASHAAQLVALLEQAVTALQNEPNLVINDLPRRARFARYLAAIDPMCLDHYRKRLAVQRNRQTDGDEVAFMIKTKITSIFDGSMTDLLALLTPVWPETASRAWPKLPNQLSNRIRKIAPGLRGIGWTVEERRTKRGAFIELVVPGGVPSYISRRALLDSNPGDDGDDE